jgi:hypothetical protein
MKIEICRKMKIHNSYLNNKDNWDLLCRLPANHNFWEFISCSDDLTEDFIRKNRNNLNWTSVSCHLAKFPETFIEEFKDKIKWYYLCFNYNFSLNFAIKNIDRLYLNSLCQNTNIRQDVKKDIMYYKTRNKIWLQ